MDIMECGEALLGSLGGCTQLMSDFAIVASVGRDATATNAGWPTSSCLGRHRLRIEFSFKERLLTIDSSFCRTWASVSHSTKIASGGRITAVRFGKIPTTTLHRSGSLLRRSKTLAL